jgi:opacity protein-like surface antigen
MTKKLLLIAAILLVVSVSAYAQDEYPKFELSGMVNMTREDIQSLGNETTWGYAIGTQYNVNKWFGIVGEWGAAHGESDFTYQGENIPLDTRTQTLLFGPRFSYRTKPVTAFGHWLVGAGTNKLDDDSGTFNFQSKTKWQVGMAIGGGMDVNLGKNFAIRAIQLDWLPVDSDLTEVGLDKGFLNNVRFMFGAVIKF